MGDDSVAEQVRQALAVAPDPDLQWADSWVRHKLAALLAEHEAMARERDKAVLTIISDAVPVYADAAVVGEHVGLPAAVHVVQQLIRYAKEQKAEVDRLRAERDTLDAKLHHNRCNSGHETLPLILWDCPECHNETRRERDRLKGEVERLEQAIKVQAAAVRRLDLKERNEYLATDTLDSERAMNATLSRKVEQAETEAARLRLDVGRLEGQLAAIAEEGTAELNAAVSLRSHLAQARIERDTALTEACQMHERLTRVVEGHKQMSIERDTLKGEVERLTWELTLAHSAYKAEAAQHTETIKEFVLERKRAEQAEGAVERLTAALRSIAASSCC